MDIKTIICVSLIVVIALALMCMAIIMLVKQIQLSRIEPNGIIPLMNSGDRFTYLLYLKNASADSYSKLFECFTGEALELFRKGNFVISDENKIVAISPPDDKEFTTDVYNGILKLGEIMETTENDDDRTIADSVLVLLNKTRAKYKNRTAMKGLRYNLPPSMQPANIKGNIEALAGLQAYIEDNLKELSEEYYPYSVSLGLTSVEAIPKFGYLFDYIRMCMDKELERRIEEKKKAAKEKEKKKRFSFY